MAHKQVEKPKQQKHRVQKLVQHTFFAQSGMQFVQDPTEQDPNFHSSTAVQETQALLSIENSSLPELCAEIEANKEQNDIASQSEETKKDCSTSLGGSGEEETDVSGETEGSWLRSRAELKKPEFYGKVVKSHTRKKLTK